MKRSAAWAGGAAAAAAALMMACGGSDDGAPTSPTTPGASAATITIGSDGRVSPASVTVPVGSRVTFTNNHTQAHEMASDPHPDHSQCPEITVGTLQAGQSRQTQNLTVARTCGFHDHDQPSNTGLQGTIRIQ